MIRYHSTRSILCQIVMCLFIILASCRDRAEEPEDLSLYYLPVDSLAGNGMEYVYRSRVDSSLREVWQHIKTSEGLITSINYDQRQQVAQKQYERVVENGVLIDSLALFFHDSVKTVSLPVRVLAPYRFPFDVRDSTQVWLTHLEWWQPFDSLHVVLQRRRRFMGHTEWNWQGKKIPAVKFHIQDKFETEKVGWTTAEWRGEEIYARNIGLVYYRRDITELLQVEFELESRKPIKK